MGPKTQMRPSTGISSARSRASSVSKAAKRPRQATLELELYRGLMWHKGSFRYARRYDRRATSFMSDSTTTNESMIKDENSEAGFWLRLKRRFTIKTLDGRGFATYSILTCSIEALVVGSHMGWATSVIEINSPKGHTGRFDLNDKEASQIMAAMPVGMIIAALPTCVLLDFLGRHAVLLISAAPLMSAWILILVATSPYVIFMSRFVAGFGAGMVLTTMPIYLSEIGEPRLRGTIVMVMPVMISAGMLLAYLLVAFVFYPADIAVLMVLPVLFFILFIFSSESPIYLCIRECWSTAYLTLKRLRHEEDYQFEIEYEDKMVSTDISRQDTYGFKNLCINNHIKRLFFLTSILFAIQQLSGIFSIFAFHQDIFEDATSPLDPLIIALGFASIQLGANIAAMVFVDLAGRRPLLLTSLFGSAACMGILGLLSSLYESKIGIPDNVIAWATLILLFGFVALYSFGIGSVPWVLLGELTLPGVRGATGGVSVILVAFCGIVSSKYFKDVQTTWGYATSFWSIAVICTIGALFVGYLIPETRRLYIVDIHRTMYNVDDASLESVEEEEIRENAMERVRNR